MRKRLLALLAICVFLALGTAAPAEEALWTCPQCQWGNTTLYCIRCGAKRPEMIVCPGCGEQYPPDTVALFCGSCGTKLRETPVTEVRMEGPGFDTPEEAVTHYLEGLRDLDMEKMLGAFAWETWEEHFDLRARILWLASYNPTTFTAFGMPDPDNALGSVNIHLYRAYTATQIFRSILAYMVDYDQDLLTKAITINRTDPDTDIDELYGHFGAGKAGSFSTLSNIRFVSLDEVTGHYSNEQNQRSRERMYGPYGADECITTAALFDMGGQACFFSAVTARYGDRWYIVNLSSHLDGILGLPVYGAGFYPYR